MLAANNAENSAGNEGTGRVLDRSEALLGRSGYVGTRQSKYLLPDIPIFAGLGGVCARGSRLSSSARRQPRFGHLSGRFKPAPAATT